MRPRPLSWVVAALVVAAPVVWASTAMTGDEDLLGTRAAQAGVIALPLTVLGLVLSVLLARRGQRASPRPQLAKAVHDAESETWLALLQGAQRAADVAYASDNGNGTPEGAGTGVLAHSRALAARLLPYRPVAAAATQESATLTEIADFYSGLPDGRLVIVGEKGSGKTVLSIELVIRLTKAIKDDPSVKEPVPVRLGASSWDPRQTFPGWLADRIAQAYGLPRKRAARLVAEHAVLPVLDGLDEIDQIDMARSLIAALNDWRAGRDYAPLVLTTRPDMDLQLRGEDVWLDRATRVEIQPLAARQVTEYLQDRYRDRPHIRAAWEPLLARLDRAEGAALRGLLATPWRLVLAITAIEDDPGVAERLVPDRGESAELARDRMEAMVMAAFIPAATRLSKDGLRRRYRPGDVHRWLWFLAAHLRWQSGLISNSWDYYYHDFGRFEHLSSYRGLSGVDIVPHTLWRLGGTRIVRNLHRGLVTLVLLVAFTVAVPPTTWPAKMWEGVGLVADGEWFVGSYRILFVLFPLYFAVTALRRSSHDWPIPRVRIALRLGRAVDLP